MSIKEVQAYYKGTTVEVINANDYNGIITSSNGLLNKWLREKKTIQDIKSMLLEQLDMMERKLFETQKLPAFKPGKMCHQGKYLEAAWGEKWRTWWGVWYSNIYILLKLKAIQDDDMNGFVIYYESAGLTASFSAFGGEHLVLTI
jgi:hypothetical protein